MQSLTIRLVEDREQLAARLGVGKTRKNATPHPESAGHDFDIFIGEHFVLLLSQSMRIAVQSPGASLQIPSDRRRGGETVPGRTVRYRASSVHRGGTGPAARLL
jgi:hypothetical protein